jgi:hypothetical protein
MLHKIKGVEGENKKFGSQYLCKENKTTLKMLKLCFLWEWPFIISGFSLILRGI